MRRRSGKISVAQVVVMLVLSALAYGGFMYLPVLLHRWALATIARESAAKMLVQFNDATMREEIRRRTEEETGIQIGMSELFLEREAGKATVTIRWTEQIKHPWGKNHVLKLSVTQSAQPGAVKMKNAT